jgi:hypothetical protein
LSSFYLISAPARQFLAPIIDLCAFYSILTAAHNRPNAAALLLASPRAFLKIGRQRPQNRPNSSHLPDRAGVAAVSEKICEELRWLFREPSSDFGVDAQVEIADDDILTGKLLGLQIKSGESFFKERTPNTIIYRGDKEHLQYWLNHKLPILIVLYDPATDTAYWEQVTEDRAVDTGRGWKLEVPFSQVLHKGRSATWNGSPMVHHIF